MVLYDVIWVHVISYAVICFGCVYFYPSDNPNFDIMAILWVRESRRGLDDELFKTVKEWLKKWPFKNPGFPGRTISWIDWVR